MNSFKFIFEVPNICYIVSNTVNIYSTRKSCAPSPDLPVVIQLHQFCISFLSLSFVWFSPEDTLSYLQCIPLQRTKSAVLLSCPGPTNSLLSFYFLVHFSLTYIVFLFRILQFRTCPHLSPYSMLFIIWGNIHYSVGRTTSAWSVFSICRPSHSRKTSSS